MNFLQKAKLLFQFGFRPIRGDNHAERLESFYGHQAAQYDDYRESFLVGRRQLMEQLNLQPGSRWLDIGCGTGYLLDCTPQARQCERIYQFDITPSLLSIARKRVVQGGWTNVEIVEADATEIKLDEPVDVATFSYSLTMIPNWFSAIDRAFELLKPAGLIGVADFYVARKYARDELKQSRLTRHFWPSFFDMDGIYPSKDHLPFLQHRFETKWLNQQRTTIPGLPFFRPPCYQFVGVKK